MVLPDLVDRREQGPLGHASDFGCASIGLVTAANEGFNGPALTWR